MVLAFEIGHLTQAEFGAMVGISQQKVSELLARNILKDGQNGSNWLLAYCKNLREQAAGRQSDGELDLVQERARLAKENADKVAMQNAQDRKELAPVGVLEFALANICNQLGSQLEAIPVFIKRRVPDMSQELYALIVEEITRLRNSAALIQPTLEVSDVQTELD